jgi:LPXTG-motif cell wall-anchored protein
MYGRGGVAGPVVATTTTVGVLTLPNTGGNIVISLAIAVASGLVVWGVLYARSAR